MGNNLTFRKLLDHYIFSNGFLLPSAFYTSKFESWRKNRVLRSEWRYKCDAVYEVVRINSVRCSIERRSEIFKCFTVPSKKWTNIGVISYNVCRFADCAWIQMVIWRVYMMTQKTKRNYLCTYRSWPVLASRFVGVLTPYSLL